MNHSRSAANSRPAPIYTRHAPSVNPSAYTTTTQGPISGAICTSGVRRNLFHHHLSRRPTAASSVTAASTVQKRVSKMENSSADIVIRGSDGEYIVGGIVPSIDGLEFQGNQEEVDREREEARLSDAVRHHCRDRNRTPSEPEELLEAVRASLRAKVDALANDRWMYEGGEGQEA